MFGQKFIMNGQHFGAKGQYICLMCV